MAGEALAWVGRLIHPQRRGRGQRGHRFGHRGPQGIRDLAVGLGDRPDAEAQPQHLIEQPADLALGQVIGRAQQPHQRQGARAQLPAGYARWQRAQVPLAAARAAAAVAPILVDLGANRRHLEDLVALRLILAHEDRRAALAQRLRPAVHDPVDFARIDQCPEAPLVAGLSPALAVTGPALRPVGLARAVRGRRLGRVARVQLHAFFERLHSLEQLPDQDVALRHRRRQDRGQGRQRRGGVATRRGRQLCHVDSFAAGSIVCKRFLARTFASATVRSARD